LVNDTANSPTSDPAFLVLSPSIGWPVVLKQIPLSKTLLPPLKVTFPPHTADFCVMFDTADVVTVGTIATAIVLPFQLFYK
jgi:hypothetical protein